MQANAGEEKLWLKEPRLPNVRIIFLDKSGKRCTAVQDYIWFGLDFKEQTADWELVRKVFKSPAAAEALYLTIFLNAVGKYRLDQISIEEL